MNQSAVDEELVSSVTFLLVNMDLAAFDCEWGSIVHSFTTIFSCLESYGNALHRISRIWAG